MIWCGNGTNVEQKGTKPSQGRSHITEFMKSVNTVLQADPRQHAHTTSIILNLGIISCSNSMEYVPEMKREV